MKIKLFLMAALVAVMMVACNNSPAAAGKALAEEFNTFGEKIKNADEATIEKEAKALFEKIKDAKEKYNDDKEFEKAFGEALNEDGTAAVFAVSLYGAMQDVDTSSLPADMGEAADVDTDLESFGEEIDFTDVEDVEE